MAFSPWLWQIQERAPYLVSDKNHQTDVCIVGGGIAGIMSAYMLLQHTSLRVTLIESDRLAHGATGHNAGQVAAYFEKPFDEIVQEYGVEKARAGQEALIAGRELLEEILLQEQLSVPYEKSTGYAAWSTLEQVIEHLRRKHLRDAGGVVFDSILVSDLIDSEEIPHMYREYITFVSPEKLTELLQTNDPQYIAAGVSTKGTINSALLCEEIAAILYKRFHERFVIAEHTHVKHIDFSSSSVSLKVRNIESELQRYTEYVVLCTNGYTNFSITGKKKSVSSRFASSRYGIIGYMIGAFVPAPLKSVCVSYFPLVGGNLVSGNDGDIYYYMTTRKFADRGLVCLGGPEKSFDALQYEKEHHTILRTDHQDMLDFLQSTRRIAQVVHSDFTRHGLMGYTKSGVREIGTDPEESRLLYNVGCNGVGICSSVYGARKIMKLFQGETFDASIFDVG